MTAAATHPTPPTDDSIAAATKDYFAKDGAFNELRAAAAELKALRIRIGPNLPWDSDVGLSAEFSMGVGTFAANDDLRGPEQLSVRIANDFPGLIEDILSVFTKPSHRSMPGEGHVEGAETALQALRRCGDKAADWIKKARPEELVHEKREWDAAIAAYQEAVGKTEAYANQVMACRATPKTRITQRLSMDAMVGATINFLEKDGPAKKLSDGLDMLKILSKIGETKNNPELQTLINGDRGLVKLWESSGSRVIGMTDEVMDMAAAGKAIPRVDRVIRAIADCFIKPNSPDSDSDGLPEPPLRATHRRVEELKNWINSNTGDKATIWNKALEKCEAALPDIETYAAQVVAYTDAVVQEGVVAPAPQVAVKHP